MMLVVLIYNNIIESKTRILNLNVLIQERLYIISSKLNISRFNEIKS